MVPSCKRMLCWLVLALLATVHSSAVAGQTPLTRQVMREKLQRAGALLAALVTSNWAELERNSQLLEGATRKQGWEVFRSPEYAKQTSAFDTATEGLIDAAKERDQTAALAAYNRVVASCVQCHRYVARLRVAVAPVGSRPR
jgi:cytochrome c556